MIRILVALCLLMSPAALRAEDMAPGLPSNADAQAIPGPATPTGVEAERRSVQAWGRDNPDCAEWSDACVACTKEGCSTPGVACAPQETVCRRK
ncbi:MAG: hypothetical protein QM651_05985 [Rhodoblastus sp.]